MTRRLTGALPFLFAGFCVVLLTGRPCNEAEAKEISLTPDSAYAASTTSGSTSPTGASTAPSSSSGQASGKDSKKSLDNGPKVIPPPTVTSTNPVQDRVPIQPRP